jgi:hypothetical protein
MPRRLITTMLIAIGLSAVAALGFFAGQSTRDSDGEVRVRLASAVDVAIDRTTREQEALRRKVIREVRRDQRKHDRKVMRRLRVKLQRSAERRSAVSYQSGQSAGYESGSADGYESGSEDGFVSGAVAGASDATDEVVCSDDPDVTWLPYC